MVIAVFIINYKTCITILLLMCGNDDNFKKGFHEMVYLKS